MLTKLRSWIVDFWNTESREDRIERECSELEAKWRNQNA